jgi:hypothetical protein
MNRIANKGLISVTVYRMKNHLEQKLVLHGVKRSEVKNLVFVDFYETHQDYVDRVVVNSKINFSIQTLKIISLAY